MNRLIGVALAATVLLGGCAMHPHDHAQRLGDWLHERPLITVKGGIISVAPEPIVVYRGKSAGPIVWRLPKGYTFPDDGIEIKGRVIGRDNQAVLPNQAALKDPGLGIDPKPMRAFDCSVNSNDRQEFSCRPAPGITELGVYRYVIRVLKDGKERIEWDPHIFSMD